MRVKKEDLIKGKYNSLNVSKLNLSLDSFYFRDKNNESIGFKIDVTNDVSKFFIETFDLKEPDKFIELLKQSVSGDGNELAKNNALHSSSLCALLMFYNVSEKTPFYLKFGESTHKYTKVYFEIKNKVIKNPSNMDVVLVNDKTKEILFIECKFSEYLSHAKHKLGKGYLDNEEYRKIFENIKYFECDVFQYGIKQLVTHYIGIKNFLKNNYTEKDLKSFYRNNDYGRRELYNRKWSNVAFLEIVFELPYDEYGVYCKETETTFAELKKLNNEIEFLGTQTYQNLFKNENKDILSEKVIEFYKL